MDFWKPAVVSLIIIVFVMAIRFLSIWCIVIAGCVFYFFVLYSIGELNRQDKEVLYSVFDVIGLKRDR